MWEIIAIAGLLLFFLIIAIVLLHGKGGALIAGFNLLPKEQKAKIDVPKFCRFIGKTVLGVCCAVGLLLANMITGVEVFNIIALVILALSVVIALVWGNIRYMALAKK